MLLILNNLLKNKLFNPMKNKIKFWITFKVKSDELERTIHVDFGDIYLTIDY